VHRPAFVTQQRLRELFRYNPESGHFIRRVAVGRHGRHRAGECVGTRRVNGYLAIGVDGKTYYAHHLAWLYVHGSLSTGQIDHKNRVRDDNRICNLRPATTSQNMRNRTAHSDNAVGYKGVSLTRQGKYKAKIWCDGKEKWLGVFDAAELAAAAYKMAAEQMHGEFASS
jgi:CDGSH-type Zn-finger protein